MGNFIIIIFLLNKLSYILNLACLVLISLHANNILQSICMIYRGVLFFAVMNMSFLSCEITIRSAIGNDILNNFKIK